MNRSEEKKKLLTLRGITRLVLALIVFGILYSMVYYTERFEVTVVDAETGEPLEDVILLAYWQVYSGSFGGRYPEYINAVREAVSDEDGKVGYQPFFQFVFQPLYWIDQAEAPVFVLYKEGYEDHFYKNKPRWKIFELIDASLNPETKLSKRTKTADWDGGTIELSSYEGDPNSFRKRSRFLYVLSRVKSGTKVNCLWEKIPHSLVSRIEINTDYASHEKEKLNDDIREVLTANSECLDIENFRRKIKWDI